MRNYANESQDPRFTETITLDLSTVVTSVSGPKRPHDRVSVKDMKKDFAVCLTNPVSLNCFAIFTSVDVVCFSLLCDKQSPVMVF